jgi:putative ABC transport system permease protein
MLWTEDPKQDLRHGRSAYWNVEQWRKNSESFADIAVFDGVSAMLTTNDNAERISVGRISPNFFPLLGVETLEGRIFSAEEAEQRQRLAVISYRLWRTRFGGSDDAVGKSIELDRVPARIVGILPPGFHFSSLDADVWEPHTAFPDWQVRRAVRGRDSWFVLGRLRRNVGIEQAQAEMSTIAHRLDEQLPMPDRNRGIRVVPLSVHLIGSRPRLALWMLTSVVGCVLLITAANLASLSLARTVARTREIAIRAALGASRLRIVRQLLAESLTLAGISGVLGTLLALVGIRLIRALEPFDVARLNLARLNEVSLDLRVLGWALAVSFLTGVLVGLAPAMTMARRDLRPSGEEGGRSVSGGVATRRMRRSLVVAEFALAMVLLIGAGLLVRSWWSIEKVDPGFRPDRVLSMELRTPVFFAAAQRGNLYSRVLEQVEAVPSVESAAFISDLFITSSPEQVVTTEGDIRPTSNRLQFRRDEVSGGFFKTLGTPLLKGRIFSIQDGPNSPRVAVINDLMGRRLWPGGDPVGKRLKLGLEDSDAPWYTVIGVVGDMRRQGLEREPIPQMFESLLQNPSGGGSLLIRTSIENPLRMVGSIQAAVRRVESRLPLYNVTTLENRLGAFLTPRRLETSLVVGFSLVALLMSAIGIYGLVQYSIATRTQEIGIRMAIGARAGQIFRLIISEGLKLSLTGLAIGLLGALWLGRAAASLLFGVTSTDPLTFIAVSLLLTAVATAACYFPARRAMNIEPTVALRRQ